VSPRGRVRAPVRETLVRRLTRTLPRPPGRVLPALLEVAAALDPAAPSLLLPPARRVLIVVPHPDDESIGAGGLLARLVARGVHVDALLVTDGEATIGSRTGPVETGRRRRGEFREACATLGVGVHATLALPDGAVRAHHASLVAAVADALTALRPDLVLAPWPLEAHADHRAVLHATAAALTGPATPTPTLAGAMVTLWTYEAHTPIPNPSHVIDVTDHVATKRAALAAHVTAAGAFDLTACLALARWRSLATRAGRGAAEAFLELTPDAALTLLASTTTSAGAALGPAADVEVPA